VRAGIANIASVIVFVVVVLAGLASTGRIARADDGVVTRPPRLTHFVEASRPAGATPEQTATVVLAIDIAADGTVADVRVQSSAGAGWDAAASAAARQFVFEPAEVDGQPAPVTITYKYAFTVEEKLVSLGPQINFEGVVVDRYKKRPIAGVKIAIKETKGAKPYSAAVSFTDLPIGATRSSCRARAHHGHHRRRSPPSRSARSSTTPTQGGIDDEQVVKPPDQKETASVSIGPRKRARSPAPGRYAQGRPEPASVGRSRSARR
jgi:TonB family protein